MGEVGAFRYIDRKKHSRLESVLVEDYLIVTRVGNGGNGPERDVFLFDFYVRDGVVARGKFLCRAVGITQVDLESRQNVLIGGAVRECAEVPESRTVRAVLVFELNALRRGMVAAVEVAGDERGSAHRESD